MCRLRRINCRPSEVIAWISLSPPGAAAKATRYAAAPCSDARAVETASIHGARCCGGRAGLWFVDRSLRGPASTNLLINTGFEQGSLPWVLVNGSECVAVNKPTGSESVSDNAVVLRRDSNSATRLAAYLGRLAVPADSSGIPIEAALSLDFWPNPHTEAAPPLPVAISLDALDADGTVISRLGAEGWTAEAADNINTVGGRPRRAAD